MRGRELLALQASVANPLHGAGFQIGAELALQLHMVHAALRHQFRPANGLVQMSVNPCAKLFELALVAGGF